MAKIGIVISNYNGWQDTVASVFQIIRNQAELLSGINGEKAGIVSFLII